MNNNLITLETMKAIPAKEIGNGEKSSHPLVSVLMLAYNHGEYIEQAIKSIINQKVEGFTFELVIGEDGSTDKTLNICKELQQKYPDVIRLIVSDSNVGMHRNFARLWIRARGKYIAFCEGDDYWINGQKLLKQVQLLEQHPDCNLCGTYTQSIQQNQSGTWEDHQIIRPVQNRDFYTFEEMIPSYNFHFSSVIVRKEAIKFPLWFWDVYCVDRPLYLLATQQGTARLIPEITSVYRHHTGGSWSPLSWQHKADKSIFLFKTMANHFEPRYKKMFYQTLGGILWFYMSESLNNQEIYLSKKLFFKSLAYNKFNLKYPSIADIIQVLIRLVKLEIVNYAKENTSNNDRVTTNK